MNDTPFVLVEDSGLVRWMTLHQPERRNAIPVPGWAELADAIADFADSGQRVVVLRGAGDDFCSGADLNLGELEEARSPAVGRRYMKSPSRVAMTLHSLAKPSIAAVDGVAVGAGMNIALGCDIVVATNRARFAELFVHRGLTMDIGGTWLLPRIVGMARARELALTGREVDAAEALAIGMISRVVAPEELESTVSEVAGLLATGAPLAQSFIKRALSRSLDMTFEQAIAFEEQAQSVLMASDDLREGITAFLEHRRPNFEGK